MMAAEVRRCVQTEPSDLSEQLSRIQLLFGAGRRLDDGKQLALERPMVALGSLSKALNDLVRGVLDRKNSLASVPNLPRFES